MNIERRNRREALQRMKQSLVDDLVGQSDEQILAQAAEDGINPDEARSRLLVLFQKAKQLVEGGTKSLRASIGAKKSTVPNIDAARARAILKRVAGSSPPDSAPLLNAARLDHVREHDEVPQAPSSLSDKAQDGSDNKAK
jgi:hypothetical protein